MRNRFLTLGLAITLSWNLTHLTQAANWPAFRGGLSNAEADSSSYPTEWSSEKNLKWKLPLGGNGNGSPIVFGDNVYVTTANKSGSTRTLHSVDRNDGTELWAKSIETEADETTHKTNPYAGTTPTADENHVVVWHGTPGVYCYNHDGEQLWHKELGKASHVWGYGSSPVIHNGLVYLNYGPGKNTFLIAIDLKTGDEVWRYVEEGGKDGTDTKLVGSWCTPVFAEVAGKTQLICTMPSRVLALDPTSGEVLWHCSGIPSQRGDLVYPSTVIKGDIGVAMGGYKGPTLGFTLTGKSDATETNRIWYTPKRQPQRIGSGVIVGDYLYIGNAGPGTIQCIDLKNEGKVKWQARGTGNYWGATVLADGRLYATSQNGSTLVFEANPKKFVQLAVNSFDEPSNATPAFSNGEIFLRTNKSLFCVSP